LKRNALEKFERGERVENFSDHAIWELMYFGKARALKSKGGVQDLQLFPQQAVDAGFSTPFRE
jgi:hypothetical protein